MVKAQSKKGLIVTIVILVIVFLAVGSVFLVNKSDGNKTSETTTQAPAEVPKDSAAEQTTKDETTSDTAPPAVDPQTLTSVAIEPLGIAVAYTKGVPGFDFAIKRTPDKTQYVEFTSTELIGTKCTDDSGLFVSIIKNPSASETQTTVSQTVKVGNDSYGLSLAGKGCTSNPELLDQYQKAFKDGFSSLKVL